MWMFLLMFIYLILLYSISVVLNQIHNTHLLLGVNYCHMFGECDAHCKRQLAEQ